MSIQADALKSMIASELADVSDQRVLDHIQALLIEPKIVLRDWDYGAPNQRFPCWTVFEDRASATVIAFCEQGFGPAYPWGLIHLGEDDGGDIGMDSAWFLNFLDVFYESQSASQLPIWQVVKTSAEGHKTVLTDDLPWQVAWDEIARLRAADPASQYSCDPHGAWQEPG